MEFKKINMTPSDVAKFFLIRSIEDGDLISPLKMQKLVYYAYVWTLVKNRKKLFDEGIEAWSNGPVVPSLYEDLKKYGSSPIEENYIDEKKDKDLFNKFPDDVKNTLDEVYEKYAVKSAFELVVLTHTEKPWAKARQGLAPEESSNKPISDEDIFEHYNSANL